MVKRALTRFLIWAIEGLNNAIGYVEHDIKRGNARKTVSIGIVLLAVFGLSFVGFGVTGQIVKAKESASLLSEQLGTIEAEYEKLSVQCSAYETENVELSEDLSVCKGDLSLKTSEYEVAQANYDKCSVDLDEKIEDYDKCSDDLSTKATQYDDISSKYNDLNSTYNKLVTKSNAVADNAAWVICNCHAKVGANVQYHITNENKILCSAAPDGGETETITC